QVGDSLSEAHFLCFLATLERRASGLPPSSAAERQLIRTVKQTRRAEAVLRQAGHKTSLALCPCEQGPQSLGRGASGQTFLQEAGTLATELGVQSGSELRRALGQLRRAQQAFEAGEHHRLFRGELIEDLPEGLRRRLVETAELPGGPERGR